MGREAMVVAIRGRRIEGGGMLEGGGPRFEVSSALEVREYGSFDGLGLASAASAVSKSIHGSSCMVACSTYVASVTSTGCLEASFKNWSGAFVAFDDRSPSFVRVIAETGDVGVNAPVVVAVG